MAFWRPLGTDHVKQRFREGLERQGDRRGPLKMRVTWRKFAFTSSRQRSVLICGVRSGLTLGRRDAGGAWQGHKGVFRALAGIGYTSVF